jgi:hypothetical protein
VSQSLKLDLLGEVQADARDKCYMWDQPVLSNLFLRVGRIIKIDVRYEVLPELWDPPY